MIRATLHFTQTGAPRQIPIVVETEQELMYKAFMLKIDRFKNDKTVAINFIDYNGSQFPWNDYAAHQYLAKGRITLEEFKTLCNALHTKTELQTL